MNTSKKKGSNNSNNKSKGQKLSTDPQSIAARERRHRISNRFKTLQSLVPGGSKLDTVSMLEQTIQYVKFLKAQIMMHQAMINMSSNVDNDPNHHFNEYGFYHVNNNDALMDYREYYCASLHDINQHNVVNNHVYDHCEIVKYMMAEAPQEVTNTVSPELVFSGFNHMHVGRM